MFILARAFLQAENKIGVTQPARAWGCDKDSCLKIEQEDLEILSFLN